MAPLTPEQIECVLLRRDLAIEQARARRLLWESGLWWVYGVLIGVGIGIGIGAGLC